MSQPRFVETLRKFGINSIGAAQDFFSYCWAFAPDDMGFDFGDGNKIELPYEEGLKALKDVAEFVAYDGGLGKLRLDLVDLAFEDILREYQQGDVEQSVRRLGAVYAAIFEPDEPVVPPVPDYDFYA